MAWPGERSVTPTPHKPSEGTQYPADVTNQPKLSASAAIPLFGTHLTSDGVNFRVWAPGCRSVALCLTLEGEREHPLAAVGEGWWEAFIANAGPGCRYRYRIDGGLCVPDPASRFQPGDLHGESEVIDPQAFSWTCANWQGHPWEEAVIYELHVGAFTYEGTFQSAITRLDALVELGVTVIELMPVAQFPGRWDWGYNGALLYAPAFQYGRPEDLKALVDAAHQRGLMVMLDVVYNHFGPEGNYLYVYAREFFDPSRHTPWGAAINFDGSDSRWVREFFIQNAIYWLDEYRFDGLRFDAVHAIEDQSSRHFVEEMGHRVREAFSAERCIHLVLENDRNEARFLRATGGRPSGFVAQWNDDMHHAFHVLLTGETDSYYADYRDDPARLLSRCLAEGFAYQGDRSEFRDGERRGEVSRDLPPTAFVNFLQNHDQIGNRAFGERLVALTTPEALCAAVAILLLSPSPPLLFMGEEWAADEPFLFFCDFGEDLRNSVREGRRKEFDAFPAFKDPAARERIPDPMAEATFRASVLDWQARDRPQHAAVLDFYRRLLALRRREIVSRMREQRCRGAEVRWLDGRAMNVCWHFEGGEVLSLWANLGTKVWTLPPEAELAGRVLFSCGSMSADERELSPWSVRWYLSSLQ